MRNSYEEISSWPQFPNYSQADEIGKVGIYNERRIDLQNPDLVDKTHFFQQGSFKYTEHGIFNPSVCDIDQELTFIFRTEPSQATWSGYFLTDKGVPQITKGKMTADGLKVDTIKPIDSGMPLACRPEDWRLFLYREKIYSNFTNYFYLNRGFPQKKVQCRTAVGLLKNDRIDFVREMCGNKAGIKTRQEEKNWMFFEYADELYCLYSIEPFIVMQLDDQFRPKKSMETNLRFRRLDFRYIACSTNPILVNFPNIGEVFFMFVHQFLTPNGKGSRNRTYYQHALVFDPKTLLPLAWTPAPLTGGGLSTKGRHDGVVYFSGAYVYKDAIYATSGEGDSNCAIYKFPIDLIEKNLRKP